MGRSIAADVLQMDGVRHLAAADPERRIAGLVRPFADLHTAFRNTASISGMNGSSSSRPLASNVPRISSLLRTCTHSPARSPSAYVD